MGSMIQFHSLVWSHLCILQHIPHSTGSLKRYSNVIIRSSDSIPWQILKKVNWHVYYIHKMFALLAGRAINFLPAEVLNLIMMFAFIMKTHGRRKRQQTVNHSILLIWFLGKLGAILLLNHLFLSQMGILLSGTANTSMIHSSTFLFP